MGHVAPFWHVPCSEPSGPLPQVALETTIGNRNPKLWQFVYPKGSVLEWLRSMVANHLALNGPSWANVFKKFNSGTYNNQWMIVDYGAFTPGKFKKQSGLLTVLEQLPGMVLVEDKTLELYNKTYWASYNIPYVFLLPSESLPH